MSKPELFNKETSGYKRFKDSFDEITLIFRESEDLTDQVKGIGAEELTNERLISSLIFTRCQKLIISILKLCSEGHGEDAGILLRTLFESSIQIQYMKKYNLFDRFLDYFWISVKIFYDCLENYALSPTTVQEMEYQEWKARVDKNYGLVESKFRSKKGKMPSSWFNKNLKEMAIDLGDEKAYDLIMKYHSSFVHCDLHGLASFVKDGEKSISFANIASFKDIELVLIESGALFSRITATWASSFDLQLPELLDKHSKSKLA